MEEKKTAGAASIRKCLAVLTCFSENFSKLSMTQIATKTNFSMPTTLRILSALCDEGFLERDEYKFYRIGWKIYSLSKLFSASDSIKNAVLPVMRQLRDKYGETVSLYFRRDIWRVCIEQVASLHDLRRLSNPGTKYPLWGGATAKVFMAYMTPQEIQRVYDSAPTERKEKWDSFMNDIALVKERGFAVSLSEREPGASSIACPIFNYSGQLAACICISGPSFRFTNDVKINIAPVLKKECQYLSHQLGHKASQPTDDITVQKTIGCKRPTTRNPDV